MRVYGELTGILTPQKTIMGALTAPQLLRGILTIPSSSEINQYDGPYEVTPKAHEEQCLNTSGLLMINDVTVFKVPYYETSNIYDGLTVFIAEDINNG